MVETPKVIQVDLEVEEVDRIGSGVRVHGYVGDYNVTIFMSADEAQKKGLI